MKEAFRTVWEVSKIFFAVFEYYIVSYVAFYGMEKVIPNDSLSIDLGETGGCQTAAPATSSPFLGSNARLLCLITENLGKFLMALVKQATVLVLIVLWMLVRYSKYIKDTPFSAHIEGFGSYVSFHRRFLGYGERTKPETETPSPKARKLPRLAKFTLAVLLFHTGYVAVMDYLVRRIGFVDYYGLANLTYNGKLYFTRLYELVLSAPLREEILFRGMILSYLLKTLNYRGVVQYKRIAVLLSSFSFGVLHIFNFLSSQYQRVSVYVVIQIFMGMLLGACFAQRVLLEDSLIAGVIVHILNNFYSMYVPAVVVKEHLRDPIVGLQILALIVFYLSVYFYQDRLLRAPTATRKKRRSKAKSHRTT